MTCRSCGTVVSASDTRTVTGSGDVTACVHCPRLTLTENDRRFLRSIRIAAD